MRHAAAEPAIWLANCCSGWNGSQTFICRLHREEKGINLSRSCVIMPREEKKNVQQQAGMERLLASVSAALPLAWCQRWNCIKDEVRSREKATLAESRSVQQFPVLVWKKKTSHQRHLARSSPRTRNNLLVFRAAAERVFARSAISANQLPCKVSLSVSLAGRHLSGLSSAKRI